MNRTCLAVAVAGALAVPLGVQAEVIVYGTDAAGLRLYPSGTLIQGAYLGGDEETMTQAEAKTIATALQLLALLPEIEGALSAASTLLCDSASQWLDFVIDNSDEQA